MAAAPFPSNIADFSVYTWPLHRYSLAGVQPDHNDEIQETAAHLRGGLGCVIPALTAAITRTDPRGARGAFSRFGPASASPQNTGDVTHGHPVFT